MPTVIPSPPRGHRDAEDGERPPLHPRGFDVHAAGARLRGHGRYPWRTRYSPIDRPMISFMISFVPP